MELACDMLELRPELVRMQQPRAHQCLTQHGVAYVRIKDTTWSNRKLVYVLGTVYGLSAGGWSAESRTFTNFQFATTEGYTGPGVIHFWAEKRGLDQWVDVDVPLNGLTHPSHAIKLVADSFAAHIWKLLQDDLTLEIPY